MSLIRWLENNQMQCLFKKHLGMECMGCGVQRSFIALLKGDLALSLELYPALIPMVVMFCFLAIHLTFKFKHGAAILKYMFIGIAGIVVVNFILKLV